MLKKTVTFTDYNGVEKTKDFYFNFSPAEITELELSLNGGLSTLLEGITKGVDQASIIEYFKKFELMAYGEKSLDGEGFVKNDAVRERFVSSPAYSQIFMEFALDAKAAADFTNNVIPHAELEKISARIEAQQNQEGTNVTQMQVPNPNRNHNNKDNHNA